MSTPIRTYITQYKQSFRQVAFFTTQGGSGKVPFEEMEALCERKPVAALMLRQKQEVETETYLDKVRQFTDAIIKQMNESTHQDN